MQWIGRRGSSNVEDNRSFGGGFNSGSLFSGRGCGCGGGIATLILAVILWFMGINPLVLFESNGPVSVQEEPYSPPAYNSSAVEDSLAQFVSVVLADTEDVWTDIFDKMGRGYRKPTLVLYTQVMQTACGTANSTIGPFYCPVDEKIYLDLAFFNEMSSQLSAGGDFAYAYVIAHEVGHHVQKLLGTLDQINNRMSRSTESVSNELSVKLELQADFYAGVWANHTEKMFNSLDVGDIQEALNAATAIGDDKLQEKAQGYVQPETFTHGTSAQRFHWFYLGYETGDIKKGDTFSANPL